MNFLGSIAVHPILPERLVRLRELANNLWWSWSPDACDLFVDLGGALWDEINHNPVHLLSVIGQERLNTLAADKAFVRRYDEVMRLFDAYMKADDTWFGRQYPKLKGFQIAYFSAEFGLHECLPIYSGGLGVLSGDHCKTASDMGLPFVGVGLLYNQGYFRQLISGEGWQEAVYSRLNFSQLPISQAKGPDGEPVVVAVDLPDRVIHALVWKVQVGRIPVYLLDTDIEWNSTEDRRLSSQLYGGDRDMRISQEIILGMGGVAALHALGVNASVFHMNEGHSAFLSLARVRDIVRARGLSFSAALEAVAAGAVFTTHTPVPAGHDAFGHDMMDRYFSRYLGTVGVTRQRFLALGEEGGAFSMSVLALNASRYANGVSKLHGQVSRSLWRERWFGFSEREMPIGHITNGVHADSWMAAEISRAMDVHGGTSWRVTPDDRSSWVETVGAIPDAELWQVHQQLKSRMVDHIRERVRQRRIRLGRSAAHVREADQMLDPHALTIGFARRFATYKRATLFFHDLERAFRLLADSGRPMQIIFAGKAHPADEPGKEFIRRLYEISQDPRFQNRVVIVEGYDINLARHLVHGVDIWLNNPRRPLEASGTSGEKAGMNGVINFSVLDGWWDEGFNGENGWTIGEPREYANLDEQDRADSSSLYETLEREIIPLYYNLDENRVPTGWVRKMKESMISVGSQFNTHRMLSEYVNDLYVPAHRHAEALRKNDYEEARSLADWKERIRTLWHQVRLEASAPNIEEVSVGEDVEFTATAHLGNLTPTDVAIELFVALVENGQLGEPKILDMDTGRKGSSNGVLRYKARFRPTSNGNYTFGIRAVPSHPGLSDRREMGLVRWAETV